MGERKLFDADYVRAKLDRNVIGYGTYEALAAAIGVSDEQVRLMHRGHRPITGKVLAWLGFVKAETMYTRPGPEIAGRSASEASK